MPVDYNINIPIETPGAARLPLIAQAIRGVSGATDQLSASDKAFALAAREALNETGKMDSALRNVAKGATGASDSFRDLANKLRIYLLEAQSSERATNRLEQALGRIGGRLGGISSGIPGGGFIGSQFIGALGLSGGAALGVGAGLGGVFAIFELTKQLDKVAEFAQKQQVSAGALGITVQQMETLTRVGERLGVNLDGSAKSAAKLQEELLKGGGRAREVEVAFERLGLTTATAFEQPYKALTDITTALAKIPDGAERSRIAVQLLGEKGRELAAVADKISEQTGLVGGIFDPKKIEELERYRLSIKTFGEEWDSLVAKLAVPATAVLRFIQQGGVPTGQRTGNEAGTPGEAGDFGAPSIVPPPPLIGLPVPPSFAYETSAKGKADRAKRFQQALIRFGTPSDSANQAIQDVGSRERKLQEDYVAGLVPDSDIGGAVASLEAERQRIKENERLAQKRASERLNLREQTRLGRIEPLSGQEAERQLIGLPREAAELFLSGGREPVLDRRVTDLYQRFTQPTGSGTIGQIQPSFREQQLETGSAKDLFKDLDAQLKQIIKDAQGEWKDARDTADEQRKTSLETIRGQETLLKAQRGEQGAIEEAGAIRGRSRGLSPQAVQQLELTRRLDLVNQQYRDQTQGLIGQRATQETFLAATARNPLLTDKEQKERAAAEAEITKLNLDLMAQEADKRKNTIEAINKFNEAVEKSAEAIRKEFGEGFASIILGAQRGQGAQALRGFAEGQERRILTNLGESAFRSIGPNLPHAQDGTFLGRITQGTLFGPQAEQKTIEIASSTFKVASDTQVKAADLQYQAASLIAAAAGIQAPGISGTSSLPLSGGAAGFPGILGSFSGLGALLGAPGGTTGFTGPLGSLGGGEILGSVLSGGTAGLTGAFGTSASAASSGTLASLKKALGAFGSGVKEAGDFTAITGGYASETGASGVAEQAGAITGSVGLALAATQGIQTALKGGAKSISAGIAETLAAVAPFTGPAAPFVAAAAGISGTISAFLPDPKTHRGNQISKSIFTQQYLAPPAENITESGNGGFADVDIYGNVRTSHISPYPIQNLPYLDVPRRQVVPGTTTGQFGGYSGVESAFSSSRLAPAPMQVVVQVQTMDSKSFNDNGHRIADALHNHLNSAWHPVVKTFGERLGTR